MKGGYKKLVRSKGYIDISKVSDDEEWYADPPESKIKIAKRKISRFCCF